MCSWRVSGAAVPWSDASRCWSIRTPCSSWRRWPWPPPRRAAASGRRLIAAAIDRARALGAARLFLGTNNKLAPAVHLYEEAGFVRITRDRLPVADYYARADILMELK
ncbi:GNAT family N-acetyltransferase [Streptomyces sp. NPDC020996]|uniref:GNAT family N-acetyltransferase n=1 Tax=Streptomyces sp. NPDC020996 TaxID=3154791 RepID=UPI0033F937C5